MESRIRALPDRPSVCLAMIVKDEAHCIADCLASVRDHISHWVICDTGSTDGTEAVVRAALEGIPGELHRHPWVNFAHNRNAALELARDRAEYVFMIDADDQLVCDPGVEPFADLTAQCYWVGIEHDGTHYSRAQLVHRGLACRFTGAVHEVLGVPGPHTAEVLRGCRIHYGARGARSRDPQKYVRDAQILEEEVLREPDNPRHVFYLAQSYRDAGMHDSALSAYLRRAEMDGWDQETFHALYSAARLRHQMDQPWETVLAAYLAAHQYRPSRLEPLLHVARHYREAGDHALGYLFSRPVVDAPFPTDALFVERGVYEYELPLEYGICCYWTGRHREAVRANDLILARSGVPAAFREAAERNRRFSVDVLGEAV
jgi:tetratricopeptide (TPR) repeat protein